MTFSEVVHAIDTFLWGAPLIIVLLGSGVYLTIRLRGIQITKLFYALKIAFFGDKLLEEEDEGSDGDITHFQALMTALSSTVGTGNIAGVATAIAIGGPGAMFWMWVTGVLGIATKYAEAFLAVRFREVGENGEMSGGPMYYIEKGLNMKWLAVTFAAFTCVAVFGTGNMVQSNSVADVLHASFDIPHFYTGIVLMVAVAAVILGGIKKIGSVTGWLVPLMIGFYFLSTFIILVLYIGEIPGAFALIIESAFSGHAATGGFLGSTMMIAMRLGVSRGLFSNESGLGTAPIAAAAAKTNEPASQALISMTQTFIDTLVVCTLTGLVLIITGVWDSGLNGAALTSHAFQIGLPWNIGEIVVSVGLALFAFSTILGWSYYGEKSIEYLAGRKPVIYFKIVFIIFVGVGAVIGLDLVWAIADIFNGLMAFPNLVALILLAPLIARETKSFFEKLKQKKAGTPS